MSTEHQQYSIENQKERIALYAACHDIDIVRTYADAAKSGLTFEGRPSLIRLLDDVQSGAADFQAILVYDVSRWGRFQDPDESAHYEYLCKAAGVTVCYCAEQFEAHGFSASILKLLKRAMAAEYSRDMSIRTFIGQSTLARQGYKQGGPPGYALRRVLVDEYGVPQRELHPGDYKCLHNQRVKFAVGPTHEVDTVRRIFKLFVTDRLSRRQIAKILNDEGCRPEPGSTWKHWRIGTILTNEKYIGNLVYGRRSQALKGRPKLNAPAKWIRCDGAFPAIVGLEEFDAAAKIVADRGRSKSDAEILAALSKLHASEGRLTKKLINRSRDLPDSATYRNRFGSLGNAYALIGHRPARGPRGTAPGYRALIDLRSAVLAELSKMDVDVKQTNGLRTVILNMRLHLRIAVISPNLHRRKVRWLIRMRTRHAYNALLAARFDPSVGSLFDYFLLPNLGRNKTTIDVGASRYDQHRSSSLQALLARLLDPNNSPMFSTFTSP